MRKQSRIVAAVVLVASLAIFSWQTLRPREPMYKGKPLSEWLEAYASPDATGILLRQKSPESDEAMLHFGTNAIPTLLQMLSGHDGPMKRWLLGQLRKQRFIAINISSASERNRLATYAFKILGPSASNAVPALISIHERHYSYDSQYAVDIALAHIAPPAKDAIPLLITDLAYGDTALYALVQIHSRPELSIPIFNKYLSCINAGSKHLAAEGLAAFGNQASNSVPNLLPLLTDTNIFVRQAATNALQAIAPKAATQVGAK